MDLVKSYFVFSRFTDLLRIVEQHLNEKYSRKLDLSKDYEFFVLSKLGGTILEVLIKEHTGTDVNIHRDLLWLFTKRRMDILLNKILDNIDAFVEINDILPPLNFITYNTHFYKISDKVLLFYDGDLKDNYSELKIHQLENHIVYVAGLCSSAIYQKPFKVFRKAISLRPFFHNHKYNLPDNWVVEQVKPQKNGYFRLYFREKKVDEILDLPKKASSVYTNLMKTKVRLTNEDIDFLSTILSDDAVNLLLDILEVD